MILAIDPGIRGCGVALGYSGRIRAAAYVPSSVRTGADIAACVAMARAVVAWQRNAWCGTEARIDEVVCEWPQTYTASKQKGDPNDLLPLAGVDCAICAFYPDVRHVTYRPSEWKGQLPKPHRVSDSNPMEQRVLARLDAEEQSRIMLPSARGLQHNTIDAVGLLLHHLVRFERHRVIAR